MKTELRRYLLLPPRLREADVNRAVFEPFLRDVEALFTLRETAIIRFRQNRWLAKREKGALPLTWEDVEKSLTPNNENPRAGLETTLARELPAVLTQVFDRLRKVLRREREPQAVGRVEQLDAACLRWLTRQPGYTVAQKAGPRQRVLAVVRRENYDILENRVLRDLLLRTERLTERWLEENEKAFPNHESVKAVKRLSNLCRKGLELETLQDVSPLHDVPKPNYVLTQDALYRRIWDAYLLVVEHYRLIEGLWDREEELKLTLKQWQADAKKYGDSFYRSELWVCPIKTGKRWVEDYPQFDVRDKANTPYWKHAESGHVTIDLLGLHFSDVLLMPDNRHPNAKPRLIDFNAPYVDFPPEDEPLYRQRGKYLLDILRNRDRKGLDAYFEQLYSVIGGSDWTILVADDWEPEWLEAIRQAASTAIGSSNVFLLWRTVAYALGTEKHSPEVSVPRLNGPCDKVYFTYDEEGRPCHHAYRFHLNEFKIPSIPKRFMRSLFEWLWEPGKQDNAVAIQLQRGVDKFKSVPKELSEKSPVYWDERMGLYVVVQTNDEQLLFKTLVDYSDRHAGGTLYRGMANDDFRLDKQSGLKLYLLENDKPDIELQLKEFYQELKEKAQSAPVTLKAEGTPGQGLFRLEVTSSALKHPEILMLGHLHLSTRYDKNEKQYVPETKQSLEYYLPRSFPPLSPRVMASTATPPTLNQQMVALTDHEQTNVVAYYQKGKWVYRSGWDYFAKAKYRFPMGVNLPKGESPLERLRRVNVFGAEDNARLPNYDWDFNKLFNHLASQARKDLRQGITNHALRLIAWTYQYDNPCFEEVRKKCIRLVVDEGNSSQVLISLCANLCTSPKELERLFLICRLPPADGTNGAERQRLLYNLLMFNDDFVETVGLVEPCPYNSKLKRASLTAYLLVKRLCAIVCEPSTSVIYRNACLRSLIYLLRIRHYDGKHFAMKEYDETHYSLLVSTCESVIKLLAGRRSNAPTTWDLMRVLLRYTQGKGRLDDLLFGN